jgi:hypothetical protein
MTLAEAIAAWSEGRSQDISLLGEYCKQSGINTLDDLSSDRLRDFLARSYIEQASASGNALPQPAELLDALASFIGWADEHVRPGIEADCLPVITGLAEELSRALDIFFALSGSLAGRGGAFAFSEFLTTFEGGGKGLYDIDVPGEAGAREGYFRVVRVEGGYAEAEDLITEDRIWPIILPDDVAGRLAVGYIINLEMARGPDGWHIVGCGFVYPPGADLGIR